MVDQREEVKSRVDLIELVSEYVKLKKAGRNWMGLCPFHVEKTPSFSVSPDLGIFKCFGCGKGGDAFTFLMEIEGVTFGEAMKILAERVGVKLRAWRPSGEEAEREKLLELNKLAKEWYKYLLLKHQVGRKGLEYLLGRGVRRGTIDKFELGWAPESWDGLFKFLVGKRRYKPVEVEKAGLVIGGKKGYYDRFRGRVMFPLKDARGQTVGFAGRVLPGAKEEQGGKYINTPETTIYHKSELLFGLDLVKEEIRKKKRVVVVEGELDMMSSWQSGLPEVVAVKGSALTESQVKRLARLAEKLILALDVDMAGDQATWRGWRVAENSGMEVRVARISEGKDPDEMARGDPEGWKKAVDEAVEIYEFLLQSALARHGVKTALGKRKIGQELLPIWAGIEDEIVRAHWVGRLAERLGVEEKVVWGEMENKSQKSKVKSQKLEFRSRSGKFGSLDKDEFGLYKARGGEGSREVLEKWLVTVVLQYEPEKLLDEGLVKRLKSRWAVRLTELVGEYFEKEKQWEVKKFQSLLPEELKGVVGELWMRQLGETLMDKRVREREISGVLRRLEVMDLKEEMTEVKEKLQKAEEDGDEKGAGRWRKRVGKVASRLRSVGS